jgi:hypothetical protein
LAPPTVFLPARELAAVPLYRKRDRVGLRPPWRAGVPAISARSDSCEHPRRQAASLLPPWRTGVPALLPDRIPARHPSRPSCITAAPPELQASRHARPPSGHPRTRTTASVTAWASGPLACGRPCHFCSTGFLLATHIATIRTSPLSKSVMNPGPIHGFS